RRRRAALTACDAALGRSGGPRQPAESHRRGRAEMTSPVLPDEAVLVVGVGLIGGSIALGLRNAGVSEIWGADLEAGLRAVDEPNLFSRLLVAEASELAQAARQAGLVVLATPLPVIEQQLEWFTDARCVTDCGSAKLRVAQRSVELGLTRFCAGHPMAGKERG